jgi:hypothetical protein
MMGWTGSQFTGKDRKQFLMQEFTQENATHKWYLTDLSMRGSTAYCIHWVEDKTTGTKQHEACVILTEKRKDDPHWIYYKNMGETVLPYYFNAPVNLIKKLNKLGEPFNDNARQWRDRCLANAEKAKIKVSLGTVLKFDRQLDFRSFKEDTFTYVSHWGKNAFKATNGEICRIPKWKTRTFEILGENHV